MTLQRRYVTPDFNKGEKHNRFRHFIIFDMPTVIGINRVRQKMKWLLPVLCLVLVGCLNTMVGFGWQKKVETLPSADQVVPFLRTLPGVTDVRLYTGEVRSGLDHWLGLNKGFQEEITVTCRGSSFHISLDHRGAKKTLIVWAVDDRSRAQEVKARMVEIMAQLRYEFPMLPPWEEMTETSVATGG